MRSVGVGLAGGEAWTVFVGGDGDGDRDGDGDGGAWRAGRRPVTVRLAAELRLCNRKEKQEMGLLYIIQLFICVNIK